MNHLKVYIELEAPSASVTGTQNKVDIVFECGCCGGHGAFYLKGRERREAEILDKPTSKKCTTCNGTGKVVPVVSVGWLPYSENQEKQ